MRFDLNEQARYYIVFKGRVQGVGFRWTCMQLAKNLGLTGWVRNLMNGNVDCEVQGPPDKIAEFLRTLYHDSRFIHIDDHTVKQIPIVKNSKGFIPRN